MLVRSGSLADEPIPEDLQELSGAACNVMLVVHDILVALRTYGSGVDADYYLQGTVGK